MFFLFVFSPCKYCFNRFMIKGVLVMAILTLFLFFYFSISVIKIICNMLFSVLKDVNGLALMEI